MLGKKKRARAAPMTPKEAAAHMRYLEAKKEKDTARLNELRRMKALDRMNAKREGAIETKPISLKELIGGATRGRAVKTMVSVMLATTDDRLRVDCAKWIIDRYDGPITNNVSVGGRDGSPIVIRDERPTLETLIGNFAKQYHQLESSPTINGDATENESIYKESEPPTTETKDE